MSHEEQGKRKRTALSVRIFGLVIRDRDLEKRERASALARIFGLIGGVALIVSWFLLNIKTTRGAGELIGNLGWLSLAIAFYNWLIARNIPKKQLTKNPKKD